MDDIRNYDGAVTRDLDIALVRTFVTAAERRSMTAAANVLHLTQGAVSQQIRRLEEIAGCALFERGRRGLRLTRAGERMLGKARRLLRLNDEIRQEMGEGAVEGSVRFGITYDLVGTSLAPVLTAYGAAYPKVDVSITCGSSPELMEALAGGAVDLAVVEEPVGPSAGECIAVDRLVWVGARGGSAHLKDPLPVSMVAETCAFRPVVLAALRERGAAWRTVFENGNIEVTTAMVRADLAVTVWLASTVPADLEILGPGSGLPELPSFAITLHAPVEGAARPARELARFIREGLTGNRRAA